MAIKAYHMEESMAAKTIGTALSIFPTISTRASGEFMKYFAKTMATYVADAAEVRNIETPFALNNFAPIYDPYGTKPSQPKWVRKPQRQVAERIKCIMPPQTPPSQDLMLGKR